MQLGLKEHDTQFAAGTFLLEALNQPDERFDIYREDILYYTAMSSYHYARLSVPAKQQERYLTFADDYLNFIGEYPESKYRRELDVMYRRSQRALGRYEGSDEELELKAKDFEKERKLLEKESGK